MDLDTLATLPVWFAIFLFSTTCHEAAHALVAKWGGDDTAAAGGQAGLDPIPHVKRSPFGMVLVPLATFLLNDGRWMIGWASAPYDPLWAGRHPRRAGWMALAGPGANLVLVLVAAAGIHVGVAAGAFSAPQYPATDHVVALADGGADLGTLALSVLFSLNLLLFAFNLLPLPPLDGSSAIALLLPRDAYEKWQGLFQEPLTAIIGLVVAWQVFGFVWGPLFRAGLFVLHPQVAYVAR